uniref:Uncharacterized protein n=1 Tax=Brassica campestris TaxID=3711 RepID=M4EE57_BRACM
MRNITVLRELGMPQKLLFSLLTSNAQLVSGKDKFEESLKKVLEMGFDPTTTTLSFVGALHMLCGLSDKTIKARVEVYKRLGFSVEDVWGYMSSIQHVHVGQLNRGFSRDEFVMIVKRHPQCLGLSAELVKKKTEFLVEEMNWPLKAVVSHPQVLGYSMEKRMVPRCNVIKALMTKGLLESVFPSLSFVLACTNEMFLERIRLIRMMNLGNGVTKDVFIRINTMGYKTDESSIETFLALGFSRGEFAMMIKRYPVCIGFSAETVKKKTEFLVEEMDWSLEAVVSHPQVFSYSMEKRMVPRCSVIRALMSKGLLGSELPSVCSVLACTDKMFLRRYVRKHDDKGLVAELMAIFTRVHKVGLVQ